MTARRIAAGAALGALLWVGARRIGPVPPLGPLLDPAHGVWAVATAAELPAWASATLAGAGADVTVRYDDRGVPHIFAATAADAYRALGFVVARDRLFQAELQARAGGGTLTELVGPAALPIDQETRALGLDRAAERILAALPAGGEARRTLDAYAAGINAYLDAMRPGDLPLEYRLLGRRPARARPIDAIRVFLRMGYTLALSSDELRRVAVEAQVGRAAADALFPKDSPIQEPIEPSPHAPRTLAMHLPPPGPPDPEAIEVLAATPAAREDAVGSNNWAVAPARTKDGYALLAGDPHLDLTLPSIWYETHLASRDGLDVYGVTIPGVPGIVLGFNRDVAWTSTNVGADVMDYYVETVDDTRAPARYRVDGAWRPLETRVERYRDADGTLLATDTMRYTHRGPLRRVDDRWISTRWTVLESTGELGAVLASARARSATEWLRAMESFQSPALNLLVADRSGTIAIRSTGRYPIRPGDGRGDRWRDGSTSASDWTGDWPVAEYPQAVAPRQGFVASANQQPRDPAVSDRYLGADWPPPWRALRINQLLRADSAVTADAMRRWQTDPRSARADRFVPFFVAAARASSDTALGHAAELLAAWDRRYTADNDRAALFEAAMRRLPASVWDELHQHSGPDIAPTPSSAMLSVLLDDSTSAWWDDRATRDRVEHRDAILRAALADGYAELLREDGPPERGGWRWSRVHRVDLHHLLGLPGLGVRDLVVSGGPSTLNPSSGGAGEGSSWRMVVALGPEVHGWGTYPGGQSGNPASRRYANHVSQWQRGELDSLRFPRTIDEIAPTATLLLRARR